MIGVLVLAVVRVVARLVMVAARAVVVGLGTVAGRAVVRLVTGGGPAVEVPAVGASAGAAVVGLDRPHQLEMARWLMPSRALSAGAESD